MVLRRGCVTPRLHTATPRTIHKAAITNMNASESVELSGNPTAGSAKGVVVLDRIAASPMANRSAPRTEPVTSASRHVEKHEAGCENRGLQEGERGRNEEKGFHSVDAGRTVALQEELRG